MAYTTVSEVRLALVSSIVDSTNPPSPLSMTAGDLPNAQLADAIAEADAQIDTYIGNRYATPVALVSSVIPHPIDYWSRNIAAYNATLTFRGGQDLEDTDPVVRRWKMTVDVLMAVAKGTATLNIPANTGDSSATGAGMPINPYV